MKLRLGVVRGLRWRLTLSYAVVTVVSVLAVEVAFLVMVQAWMFGSADFAALVGRALDGVAPEAVPYLDRTPPDASGLQSWLANRMRRTYLSLPFNVDVTDGSNAILAVVDPDGRTLASANPNRARPGEDLASRLPPEAGTALRAALARDPDPAHRAMRAPSGAVVVAAPITSGGRILGAVVLLPDLAAAREEFLSRAAGALLASAAGLTILFGVLGTLFGYAWARWLTRRLRVLTDAVEAWGRGELGHVARDSSADELGQHACQLNRMAEELRALLAARESLAVLEERQRLARDLHDAVKQQVFAAAMQIGAAKALLELDPAVAREHLAEAEGLIHQAQGELTGLIRELRPTALGGGGLAPALDAWVRDWSRRTGIAADVQLPARYALPVKVEQALFRVVQEALANVARHSGASRVVVRLIEEGEAVALTIADDGRGFDVERALGQGLGLTSMRERIEALGGMFHPKSTRDGTRLDARISLDSGPLGPGMTRA